MDTAAFDYELPPDRIAQTPMGRRDQARLLLDAGAGAEPSEAVVADLPHTLHPGDVVVVNDTKVIPARIHLQRTTGGKAEVLLLSPTAVPGTWEALVRPSRSLPPGAVLRAPGGNIDVFEVADDLGEGRRLVRLIGSPLSASAGDAGWVDTLNLVPGVDPVLGVAEALGEMPLPPYITARLDDPNRYQTVYARAAGSAAAPTAGLHLTQEVLTGLQARGIPVLTVELRVGLGTFRPITTEHIDDHQMHHEQYVVTPEVMAACETADRVVAIGTTTLRALEAAAATGELSGRTDLFIRHPYSFAVVDVLLTNFHLPKSSLLVLIDAFVGPRWRDLYVWALAHDYRFLSFGDAMLLDRTGSGWQQ